MQSKKVWLSLAPAILLLGLLYGYPILLTLVQSFQQVSLFGSESVFVGLDNYIRLFRDPQILNNLMITIHYTIITVVLKLVGGLGFAILLNQDIYFKKLWRFIFLLPWAMPQVAVAVLWQWIYDGNYGYLNFLLMSFNLIQEEVAWLADPNLTIYMVSIVDAWMGWPLVTLMFLSGLKSIPNSLYEAASIDGASRLQKFFHITLPSIRPITYIIATLVTIWTFNSFNVIYVLTQGGPLRSTETLMMRIYIESFSNFDFGYSSAISMVVIILLSILTFQYIRLIFKEDEK